MKPKKLLSFLLATAMTISLLPTFTLTASAATTTEKNITLGTSALSEYDSTNGYDYIYYGTYNMEAVKWRVLDMAYKYNNDDTNKTGMLVLSENALSNTAFGTNNTWNGSTAQDWCNSMYNSSFGTDEGTKEQDFILGTTSADNILSNDYLFFLSYDEACKSEYFPNDSNRIANLNGNAVWWWLRSPYSNNYVFCVLDFGDIYYDIVKIVITAARPAFNLNLSSVLFTSAAKGGKSSTAAAGGGAEILKNADLSTLTDNDGYKLTMLDESRKDFSASLKSLSGNTAKVSYSGAKTGTTETKEYISVIIKNENDVKYYGRACEVSSASGDVDITLPSGFDEENGDLLCVFNEQINGDYKTDYASNFVTVVTTETGLKNAVKSNGTVVLGKDITISETLEIDKNVILDLAGFTLTKESAAKTDYGVIKVNENTNFTLKDSSTAHTGKITGGNADDGSGVYVDSDSTFVMEGGTIFDCTASSANANVVYLHYGATFNMKGGIIRCSDGNYAVCVFGATVKNDSQTSATVCYGLINNYGTKIGNTIWFKESSGTIYATELIPDNGKVEMPDPPTKAGYSFDGWYTKDGTNDDWGDEFTPETTITEEKSLYARWTAIPAEEPTVSGSDVEVTYGSCTNGTISVTVTNKDENTYSYSYQWKDSSENAITGATENTYTIPNNLAAGSYDYYCAVTAKRKDNGKTATTEKRIKVTVNKADSQTTTTANKTVTYGETLTLTATVTKSARTLDYVDFYVGEDDDAELLGTVKVTYTDGTHGTATLTIDTTQKKLKIGSNTITAQYGGSVNLNGSESDTITVTLNPKPVGLSWSGYDTRDYDGLQSNVTATTNDFVKGDDVSLNIEGGNKKNAGTHTATASLNGKNAEYYTLKTEDATKEYTIDPKTVEATISDIDDRTYTGSEIKPTITVKDGNTTIPESEYDVVYSNNINAGTATVTLTNKTGGNYIVSGNTTFEILPKSIDDGATVGTFAEMTYNGTEQTPSAEVSIDGLTATGEWSKVKNVSDKTTFTASGNFTGKIDDKETGMKKLSVIIEWKNTEGLVFDNTKKTITAEVSNKKGDDVVNLAIDGDLTGTSKGTYTATVTAVNNENYTIENGQNLEKEWVISQANDNVITNLAINGWTYGNTENTPTATAKYGTPTFAYSEEENGGYAATVPTNAGTYWVKATVAGTEDYAEVSSDPISFTIAKKSIIGATVGTFAEMTYNGTEQTPSAEVSIDGLTATGEWSKVKNVSDKTTFTADGNFEGTISDITPNMEKKSIENATVALDGELTYSGQPQTQNITLTLDGFTNVTFDVSGNEQTNVKTDGDYTLTVTGTGNFSGTKTLVWNIKPYTPAENPNKKTTARVRRGRTLADATVTNGEMLGVDGVTALEGTFAWVDDTKTMSADGTEQMTFTPNEEIYGKNYATMTIDVAVSTYSSGGGGTSRYTVKFDTNGGNTITNQTVTKNSKATEPAKPTKEGYIFDGWYTDSKFTTEYDFDTKVTKSITLYAKWVEDEVQEPSDDNKDDEQRPTADEWKNPFTDVKKADWFFDNVRYANENGLMGGVTNTTFAPNDNLTRAMLVTVLWRADGEPVVNYAMPFTDIIDTAYYAGAVRWAASENIVNGVTETEFAPDENITREQIAAIIYRYAKFKGYDVSVGEDTNILSYTDFDEISEYAIEAMQYAVGMGLMKGKTESTLNPKDNATRAEIAAILGRFIESNK